MFDLAPSPWLRFFDANGAPLAGGKLYTYRAGTTTPLTTYADATGDTPNENPIVLDGDGYASVFLGNASYKFVLTDEDDVVLKTQDNVQSAAFILSRNSYVESGPFEITEGQSETALGGELFDSLAISSVEYLAEILRGSLVISNLRLVLQWSPFLSSWIVAPGETMEDGDHPNGVTFSVLTTGTTGQLLAAVASDTEGDGTIKLKKITYAVA